MWMDAGARHQIAASGKRASCGGRQRYRLVGLPAQQGDQIFKAFFTTKSHGQGMGLSISRSIVESHGGRLWAADTLRGGASFHFALATKAEAKE